MPRSSLRRSSPRRSRKSIARRSRSQPRRSNASSSRSHMRRSHSRRHRRSHGRRHGHHRYSGMLGDGCPWGETVLDADSNIPEITKRNCYKNCGFLETEKDSTYGRRCDNVPRNPSTVRERKDFTAAEKKMTVDQLLQSKFPKTK